MGSIWCGGSIRRREEGVQAVTHEYPPVSHLLLYVGEGARTAPIVSGYPRVGLACFDSVILSLSFLSNLLLVNQVIMINHISKHQFLTNRISKREQTVRFNHSDVA